MTSLQVVKIYFPAGHDTDQLQCCGDVRRLPPMLSGPVYELYLDYWEPSPGSNEQDIRFMGNRLSAFLRGASAVHMHVYQNDVQNVDKDMSTFDCCILLEKLAQNQAVYVCERTSKMWRRP